MNTNDQIAKLPTYIEGFDEISKGGLPSGRTTIVTGTAGSAKTLFAAQFLVESIKNGESGVFVTFEEPPVDIRRNINSFGWDITEYEKQGKWAFVDASPGVQGDQMEIGDFDFSALQARIKAAIKKTGAKRVSIDSLGAVFSQFENSHIIRRELFSLTRNIKEMGVTAVMTMERMEDYGSIGRFGVEEFVADNVIIFRNILAAEKRRRTIEILKYRGTNHQKGEYPFTINAERGMVIIPLSAIELTQKSSNIRVTSGNSEMDKMCDSGFFRDSIILLSGATGTGKTLMATEFLAGGVQAGEKALFFAFEESREQIFRNAKGWGYDFEQMEKDGKLEVAGIYPESEGLEDHLLKIKNEIKRFKPNRIAIDSLSALERISTDKGFREFIIALTSFVKQEEITGLFTSTASSLMGGTTITETHISTITDSIILLRYVETHGEIRRGLTVLKMRGSKHEKNIREFMIDNDGMHIGQSLRDVAGVISGNTM